MNHEKAMGRPEGALKKSISRQDAKYANKAVIIIFVAPFAPLREMGPACSGRIVHTTTL
jgi:hypothetical protein